MELEGTDSFNKFIVGNIPTVMYVPDFVTNIEETQLLNNINEAPLSKWKSLKNRRLQNWGGVVHEKGLLPQDIPPWLTKITQRIYEKSGLFPSAINHILINEYLPDQGIMSHQDGPAYFPVVAVLSLGSTVVMDFTPHSRLKNNLDRESADGEAFVAETKEWKDNHHSFSILLMPRSLLIFKDCAYADYLHGIKDSNVHQYDGVRVESPVINDTKALTHSALASSTKAVEVIRNGDPKVIHRTSTRVSLTCRLVLKVHKNLFKI